MNNKEPIRLIKGTMGLRSLCHFEIVEPGGKDLNFKEFDLYGEGKLIRVTLVGPTIIS